MARRMRCEPSGVEPLADSRAVQRAAERTGATWASCQWGLGLMLIGPGQLVLLTRGRARSAVSDPRCHQVARSNHRCCLDDGVTQIAR
jgi:hypothetical protein